MCFTNEKSLDGVLLVVLAFHDFVELDVAEQLSVPFSINFFEVGRPLQVSAMKNVSMVFPFIT